MSRLPRPLLALMIAALAATVAAASASAAVSWKRCEGESQYDTTFACASVPVPLNHADPGGRQLTLAVRRARSAKRKSKAATLVLVGGPGGASPRADLPNGMDFLEDSDILLVDLRGTGESGALACDFSGGQGVLTEEAQRCWEQLGDDRSLYGTAAVVDDLEAIRRAAGYARLNLYAVSYGTKVAYDYASKYRATTGTLLLDSVVPPEGVDPWMTSTLAAIPRVLTGLCKAGRCRGVTADPNGDLSAAIDAVRRGLTVSYVDPAGKPAPITLTEADLLTALVTGDQDPSFRLALPAALAAARAGDPAALARIAAVLRGAGVPDPQALSYGDYLATVCEETSFPWAISDSLDQRRAAVAAATAARGAAAWGPFSPAVAGQLPIESCIGWPTAGQREVSARPPLPGVRTLLLTGTLDLRTPVEDARAVAGRIPGSALVSVAGAGHGVMGNPLASVPNCGQRSWERWLRRRAVRPNCSDYFRGSAVDPLPPRSLDDLPRERGIAGRRGRTVTAVLDTIGYDAFTGAYWASANPSRRIGGLRGGTLRERRGDALLTDYEFVPGVRVSGKLLLHNGYGDVMRFNVSGPAASKGYVLVDEDLRVVGGRLDGRKL